jgi:hypothetical protein
MQEAKFFEKQLPDFSKTCGRRKIAAIPSSNQMKTHLIATWYKPIITLVSRVTYHNHYFYDIAPAKRLSKTRKKPSPALLHGLYKYRRDTYHFP